MYRTTNSDLMVIISCPLVFLAVLCVPTPVQSQHPYRLISATVDKVDPDEGQDVFTSDTYRMIEYAYVDDRISQVRALTRDGTEKIARFRSLDYHTMISNVVFFDTGNPNRVVKCEFENKYDVEEFYGFLRQKARPFHRIVYGVTSVLQYNCTGADCQNGTCDDCSRDDNYHNVSPKGKIYIETRTRAAKHQLLTRRYVIRSDDGTMNMMFTSRTFNVTSLGQNANMMMSIRIKHLIYKILIQFEDQDTAINFLDYVNVNHHLDRGIPLIVPNEWREFF